MNEIWELKSKLASAEARLGVVTQAAKQAFVPLAALIASGSCVNAPTELSQDVKVAIVEAHDALLSVLSDSAAAPEKEKK